MLELSRREARRLMIGSQLLSGPVPKRPTKVRMREVIRHLGAVQIDSISVVQRSHHIVLWSRLGNHPPEWLSELLADDRAIFEYWVHAAGYAPIELFPYFRRNMLEFAERTRESTNDWITENQDTLQHVLDFVRANGAVTTKSFEPPPGSKRAEPWAWYGNKPTNLALDILWSSGELMIERRDKFQRVYNLTERVHPTWDDSQIPPAEEAQRALALVALNALGVTTSRWLPDYFRSGGRRVIAHADAAGILNCLVESGDAVPARIHGIDDPAYVATRALDQKFRPSRTTLLSPFDSLVWHRRRTRELFDFELFLEAYTPKAKRVYGYYSLPILYRDQLVGRLDPKAHRKTGQFEVLSLHLEPWFVGKDDERFYTQLAATLTDFRCFNGTNYVTVGMSNPPEARERLEAALAACSG